MVNVEQIRRDLMFLAGQIMHRGAQTNEERRAAEYIQERFREYTGNVELDDFHAIDSVGYLFASYYGEFVVVAIFAMWWPVFAACYGAGILAAYLAEFMGYPIFSRFMPQFESQNVVARFLAPKPARTIIVMAHYDSGCASPLSEPGVLRWLRALHTLTIAAMVLIIATCIADGVGLLHDAQQPVIAYIRWGAVAYLVACAAGLFFSSARTVDIRGANMNASGVAALLHLADRFSKTPLENADLWLAATGSHEAWMAGLRHLLRTQRLDKETTYILNLEAVGAGSLHYLKGEGVLGVMPSAPDMVAAAAAVAADFGATPGMLRHVPSAAHIPLGHGYPAMTIMGLDENRFPVHWNAVEDLVTAVDERQVGRAADFAEAILRRLEQTPFSAGKVE